MSEDKKCLSEKTSEKNDDLKLNENNIESSHFVQTNKVLIGSKTVKQKSKQMILEEDDKEKIDKFVGRKKLKKIPNHTCTEDSRRIKLGKKREKLINPFSQISNKHNSIVVNNLLVGDTIVDYRISNSQQIEDDNYDKIVKNKFGFDYNNDILTYDLLRNNSIVDGELALKPGLLFQNRKDMLELAKSTFENNYFCKSNLNTSKNVKLLAACQNNGTGKSYFLEMLKDFVPEITVNSKKIKILHLESQTMIFEETVIKSLINLILRSLRPQFENNLVAQNITYSVDTLNAISFSLNLYICGQSQNEKQKGWNNLLSYFHEANGLQYKEAEFELLVFYFDEIGNVPEKTAFYNEEIWQEYSKAKFSPAEINKILSLYELRIYLADFTKYQCLESVVAGKNSFLPIMGKCKFNNSPLKIEYLHFKSLNTSCKYIERIVQFELLKICRINSSLKIKLKSLIDESNKLEFELMMSSFFKVLGSYSGGHPRLLEKIIDILHQLKPELYENFPTLETGNDYDKSFDRFFLDPRIRNYLLHKDSNDTVIFDRFNDAQLLNSLYRIKGIKAYDHNVFLYCLYKFYNDQLNKSFEHNKNPFDKLINFLTISNDENPLYQANSKLEFSLTDILISIGIPYELDSINNSIKKLIFPKYLLEYINDEIQKEKTKKEDFLTEFVKRISIFDKKEGKQIEEMFRRSFYVLLSTKTNLKDFFGQDDFEINHENILFEEISGKRTAKNYKETIINQLRTKINLCLSKSNPPSAIVIKVLLENNYAHDFFILVKKKNAEGYYLFSIQVKKSDKNKKLVEKKLSNSKKAGKKTIINNQGIITQGAELAKSIATILGYSGKYILVCNQELNKNLTESLKNEGAFIVEKSIVAEQLIKTSLEIESQSIDNLLKSVVTDIVSNDSIINL